MQCPSHNLSWYSVKYLLKIHRHRSLYILHSHPLLSVLFSAAVSGRRLPLFVDFSSTKLNWQLLISAVFSISSSTFSLISYCVPATLFFISFHTQLHCLFIYILLMVNISSIIFSSNYTQDILQHFRQIFTYWFSCHCQQINHYSRWFRSLTIFHFHQGFFNP